MGGIAADYVFYNASMAKAGDHIMSIHKVRAVYAYKHPQQGIVVAEYEFKSGLHVTIRQAKDEDLPLLSQGKDVKAEVVRRYRLELEGERGEMARLKITKPLSIEKQNDLLNLAVLMTLERWPIIPTRDGAGPTATAPEPEPGEKENPEPEAEGKSR